MSLSEETDTASIINHQKISILSEINTDFVFSTGGPGEWGTPYTGFYGEAPPKRGTYSSLHVYERVEISLVEVY